MTNKEGSNILHINDVKFIIKNFYVRYKGTFKDEKTNPKLNDVKHLFESVVHMCEYVIDNYSRISEEDLMDFEKLLWKVDTIHNPLENPEFRAQKATLIEDSIEQEKKYLTALYGYDPNKATVTKERVIKLYEEIKFDVGFLSNEYVIDGSRIENPQSRESIQIQYNEVLKCLESLLDIVLSATTGKIEIPMSDAEITLNNCKVLANSFRRTLYSSEIDTFHRNMMDTWQILDKIKEIYHMDPQDKKYS